MGQLGEGRLVGAVSLNHGAGVAIAHGGRSARGPYSVLSGTVGHAQYSLKLKSLLPRKFAFTVPCAQAGQVPLSNVAFSVAGAASG